MSIILNNERLSVEIAPPREEPNATRRFDRAGPVTQAMLDGIHKFCSREPDNLPHKSSSGHGLCYEYQLPELTFTHPLGGQSPKSGTDLMTKDLEGKSVLHHSYPCLPYGIEAETAPAETALHILPNFYMEYVSEQTKTVILRENRLVMEIGLKNAGKQRLVFEEHCHSFVTIDKMSIGPEYMVHLPVLSLEGQKPKTGCALKGTGDGTGLVCCSNELSPVDIEKEKLAGGTPFVWKPTHENAPASISESVSYIPARVTVWAIDHIVSPEIICHFEMGPGESVSQNRTWALAGQLRRKNMGRNHEIGTPIRGKCPVQRESIDATSWVSIKLLREQDDTRIICEVDPFAEVYRLRDHVYGLFTMDADGMGDPWMYLIVGSEKASLIDTDFGIDDLKGLVEQLADGKPVMVANTHCSFGRGYGNYQLEQCFYHENEAAQMEEEQNPHIWDYLSDEQGDGIWLDIHREGVITYREYEIIPMPDQYRLDLGDGYEVELIRVPGHKPRHVVFLDKKGRLSFAGNDAINMRVGIGRNLAFATVEVCEKEMRKLAARKEKFDCIFPGHFIFNLESTVVDNLAETVSRILSNPEDYDALEEGRGKTTRLRYVKGLGIIRYGEDNTYKNGETEG